MPAIINIICSVLVYYHVAVKTFCGFHIRGFWVLMEWEIHKLWISNKICIIRLKTLTYIYSVSIIYNKYELKNVQLLGNWNPKDDVQKNQSTFGKQSWRKEIRLTFVLPIFSDRMTIAQVYKILERQRACVTCQ